MNRSEVKILRRRWWQTEDLGVITCESSMLGQRATN